MKSKFSQGIYYVRTCGFAGLVAVAALMFAGRADAQVVAFGSSSTYGQGVSRGEDYPAKLQAALRARGYNVSVTNAGVSGDTSAGGLSRIDSAVPAGTQVAIIELGVNDQYAGISAAATRANINAMVSKVRARGTQVLVIGYRGSGGSLAGVASANGARYTDFNFANANDAKYRVAGDPQAAARGYGHFNSAGYDQVVAKVLPHVIALLGKK
jgi:acyl-CoA thioesterase-1